MDWIERAHRLEFEFDVQVEKIRLVNDHLKTYNEAHEPFEVSKYLDF